MQGQLSVASGFVWVPFSFMGGDSQRVQPGVGSAKPRTMASGWVGVGSPPRACWPHPHCPIPGLITPDLSALAWPTRLQPHHHGPVSTAMAAMDLASPPQTCWRWPRHSSPTSPP